MTANLTMDESMRVAMRAYSLETIFGKIAEHLHEVEQPEPGEVLAMMCGDVTEMMSTALRVGTYDALDKETILDFTVETCMAALYVAQRCGVLDEVALHMALLADPRVAQAAIVEINAEDAAADEAAR